jgi:hypothetical protein
MDLKNLLVPRALMKSIDILRHERESRYAPRHFRDRHMPCVRLAGGDKTTARIVPSPEGDKVLLDRGSL